MDALASVRREIRRLQEQQRRARCVQARLGLTRTEHQVAVGCYTQSNYNLPLAITTCPDIVAAVHRHGTWRSAGELVS